MSSDLKLETLLGSALSGSAQDDVAKGKTSSHLKAEMLDREELLAEARLVNPKGAAELEKLRLKYEVAKALRALRRQADISQENLAEASNMRQEAVSRIESPTGSMPTIESLKRYAVACGATCVIEFSRDGFSSKIRLA